MTDQPIDLAARRWDHKQDPNAHTPTDALEAVRRDIESGEIDVKHVVICVAVEGNRTRFYQAGKYDYHGQLGLVARSAMLMAETANEP